MSDESPDYDAAVSEALSRLDGSDEAAVSLLTGLTTDEIADLGGIAARPIPPEVTP